MKSVYEIEEKIQELDEIASRCYRDGDWENGNHFSIQATILKWALEDSEKKTTIEIKNLASLPGSNT